MNDDKLKFSVYGPLPLKNSGAFDGHIRSRYNAFAPDTDAYQPIKVRAQEVLQRALDIGRITEGEYIVLVVFSDRSNRSYAFNVTALPPQPIYRIT